MPLKNKIYKVLKWSEKYTKTDMVYLASGGFWLSFGQIITAISSFLLTVAFANLVSKDVFGTYRFVISLTGILAIPTLSGINTAILQATARGKDGSFIPALKTKLRWGVLGGIGSLILSLYYFLQGNITLTISFLIVAAFVPLMDSFSLYEPLWSGRKKFNIQNKYRAITNILSAIALILVIIFTENLFLMLFAYFFSWTILHLIFLLISIKKANLNNTEDPKTIPYGKHLSLMGIIGRVDGKLDKILLWHFLGAEFVAIYYIALALPLRIKEILKVISSLAFPKFSQRTPDELKKSVPRKMFQILLITVPIAILYILIAPFLFKIFFPKYSEFVVYSQAYILILVFFPRTLLGTSLTAKMQTKSLYLSSIILSPTYIILLLLLVPSFGIWGAIISFLILEAVTFTLQYILFRKM